MSEAHSRRLRLAVTGVVLLAEVAHLAWQHFHGGVVSHHILHRADMPAISNWWGLLVLPLLAWFLSGRIARRVTDSKLPLNVIAAFVIALLFGVLLSVAFTFHQESLASCVFGATFLLALLLPAYRAECVLGFVLGMAFTFGAVLPTAAASILAGLSAVVHLVLRPLVTRV